MKTHFWRDFQPLVNDAVEPVIGRVKEYHSANHVPHNVRTPPAWARSVRQVRHAAYDVLRCTMWQPGGWGLQAILSQPGFREFLEDRDVQNSKVRPPHIAFRQNLARMPRERAWAHFQVPKIELIRSCWP